ncbi:16S rRNA methyltransferase B [Fictibacillus macauensis ZFHKF-1]|uniref:16S rRNA (cytosine(967)-C(5))-methyltransferase n=1 Tax=Fictibacillus macauensis ZFHKF-1 TaxID=1196324 RepID=I8IZX7_9BACL|nr:16S rRNA (cytosine(967)-C(5))-methyltransferase RsmB [Fictibacillus macauensis]EIT85036.1 16S rRNA methyltransferase B [Fictibacillus macauensis ZFHKF-1]
MKNNVRNTAVDVLLKIEQNQAYSNLLLHQAISSSQLNAKDVGLLTELVYGTTQRKNTLDYYLTPFIAKGLHKLEPWVLVLLRVSLYQMIFLDKIPDHAILNEAVEIAKKRGHKGISGLVNGVLRKVQRQGVPSLDLVRDEDERLALRYSLPTWLMKRWVAQYGREEAEKMAASSITPSSVTGRVNVQKGSREELQKRLQTEGVMTVEGELAPEAIQLEKGSLSQTQSFSQGYVTIQDESSMLVARGLGPKESETILDACAAPGGKTTHIAELLNNSGSVVALDLHKHKVKLIEEQAKRLHLTNIETKAMDSRKAPEHFPPASFDRILVDAPCTGFGVIRKKPDLKWSKKEEDIHRISTIQMEILNSVATLLKPGGTLVYSTCTVDHEENQEVAQQFLATHPEFTWDQSFQARMPEVVKPYMDPEEAQVQILPHYFNSDGFYLACFTKTNTTGGGTQC